MNRRRKRIISGSACAILTLLGLVMPTSFIVETSGPALDVSGEYGGRTLVTIEGVPTYTSDTSLYMTTVSAYGTADYGIVGAQVVASVFSKDMQSVPVRALYSPDKSAEDVNEENSQMMLNSQDTSVAVAAEAAGFEVRMVLKVASIADDSPAAGKLAVGDTVTAISVGGARTDVESYSDLSSTLAKVPAGSTVEIEYTRDGTTGVATFATVANTPDSSGWTRPGSRIGVGIAVESSELPFQVTFGVEGIGGPSAGLMFSLEIYDRLTEGSIGGDARIAGTGTISANGEVGAIGGIPHKLVGAADSGAEYFIAPATNCEETIGYEPKGMQVFAVHTFDEAVGVVEAIGAGDTSELLTCRQVVKGR